MRSFASLAAASLLALGVAAPAVHANDIVVGFTSDASTLDPANHRSRETETILRNMYDGILTRDSAMQIVPQIAESYKQVSPTVYDFKIRKGVKFHDGSTLTPEDVAFTLDRHRQEGRHGRRPDQPAARACSAR